MNSRRPPLFTCGYSLMSIAYEIHRKAKHFNGPFGSPAKKINNLDSTAFPIFYVLQCQILVILLYLDECILAVENKVEVRFPPSKNVFDKIDEYVHVAETLPAKLDDGFERFPSLIRQVPFLEWVLVYAISLVNILVSKLTDWRSGCKEKEIVVDTNCNENVNESATKSETHLRAISFDGLPGGTETRVHANITRKGSYKDALLDKTAHKIEKENREIGTNKHDDLIELFESSWLLRPGNKIKALMPRSASYQL